MKFVHDNSLIRPMTMEEDLDDDCPNKPLQSNRMIYIGANLPCTGINTCDDFTLVVQKIDAQLCILLAAIEE